MKLLQRRNSGTGAWARAVLLLLPIAAAATLTSVGFSQDFNRYQPQPPVSFKHCVRLPILPASPIEGSTDELVDRLTGILILDSVHRLQDPIRPFQGIRIDPKAELTVAREDGFLECLRPYLDQPISERMLNELAHSIVQRYREHRRPVVDVTIPAGQEITDGVVQLVITESRIGQIRFAGISCSDDDLLRQQSWLRPGQSIYEPCLEEDLIWLNRNPSRRVSMELCPGAIVGTTDVVYNVDDEQPGRWYTGYENSGVQATSQERLFFGFDRVNVGGSDRRLSYQYMTDPDFDQTRPGIAVHSLSYEGAVFENRDTWMLFGSWAEINAAVDPVGAARIISDGSSWQLSGRYVHTLWRSGCQLDTLTFGLDTKGTNTFADFGDLLTVNPAPGGINIVNLVAGVRSEQWFTDGSTVYAADLFVSPGGLLTNNHARDFKRTRDGALSTYAYARGFLERLYHVDQRSDVLLRLSGQLASGELLPTEQMGFGGFNTVRGYDMRTLNGDNGYIFNMEYRSRPIRRELHKQQTSLMLLAFTDFGQQFNWGHQVGFPNADVLAGAGVGVRYLVDSRCSIRCDYGVPLTSAGSQRNDAGRVHIGAVIAY